MQLKVKLFFHSVIDGCCQNDCKPHYHILTGMISGQLSVRPVKIVAGHEPEKTNEFLQAIGTAILNKVRIFFLFCGKGNWISNFWPGLMYFDVALIINVK